MRAYLSALVCLLALLLSCGRESVPVPKPRAYYRIDLPEAAYQKWDTSIYPYAFEYSTYAEVNPREDADEPYWINIHYPQWDVTLHVSYKSVHGNLEQYIEDARFFTTKQIPKAEDMMESEVYDTLARVYGKIYEISGIHVACPYQFWLTDKEKHFFRGALYFNTIPNNDSVAPVLQFVEKDMLHLIETFSWKN